MINNVYFSVIIPTLNEEKYLPKILEDLKKQTNKIFEVIVVDGKSKDKTEEVALRYKQVFQLGYYKVDKNNAAYQRNYGAQKAQGLYLIFLDADSRITSSFIKTLYKFIKQKKGLIFLPYLAALENNPQTNVVFKFINFMIAASQNLGKPFSSGGSIIIKKNIFNLINGFDEELFITEDHDLIQKAYNWGIRAKCLNQIKVKFSLRRMQKEGQLTVLYKYIAATAHMLINGKVKDKIFDYEMGGGRYDKRRKNNKAKYNLKTYLTRVELFFKKLFSNN